MYVCIHNVMCVCVCVCVCTFACVVGVVYILARGGWSDAELEQQQE